MLRLIVIAKVTYSPAPALRADPDHARVIWLMRFTQQPLNDLAGHLVDAGKYQGVVGAGLPASLLPQSMKVPCQQQPCRLTNIAELPDMRRQYEKLMPSSQLHQHIFLKLHNYS